MSEKIALYFNAATHEGVLRITQNTNLVLKRYLSALRITDTLLAAKYRRFVVPMFEEKNQLN